MNREGYSYTTITMKPGEAPRVHVSVYPDRHASVRYFTAQEDSRPIMALDHDGAHVTIGITRDMTVTDAHVDFARELASAAARFLAACEHLRDEHATRDDQAGQSGVSVVPGAAA